MMKEERHGSNLCNVTEKKIRGSLQATSRVYVQHILKIQTSTSQRQDELTSENQLYPIIVLINPVIQKSLNRYLKQLVIRSQSLTLHKK